MIGGLLTICGCNACPSNIPELPGSFTKLIKGLCANTQMSFTNINGFGETGPFLKKFVILSGLNCENNLLETPGSAGPFPAIEYNSWKFPSESVEEYLLVYNINSTTLNNAEWNLASSTVQTTTGGYARQSDNTILITGGIPIIRKRYLFNLTTPIGLNNEPDFWFEEFEDVNSCCCNAADPSAPPCPSKTFGNVTGGLNYFNRIITPINYDLINLTNIFLFYPGVVNNTHNAFTINLANNPTNNSKSWTAVVSGGTVTLTSSAGDVAGPYSGSLSSIVTNLASNSTWFSSVTLSPNFVFSGANTVAQGTDLPDWVSPSIQRGVNGTSISVPILFANAPTAPSTYQCGFYSAVNGSSFFGFNFGSVAGITPYNQNAAGYLAYLTDKRYAKKSTFVDNIPERGLYYTSEYDSWLKENDSGNTWSRNFGPSVHTRTYSVVDSTVGRESYTLKFNGCFTGNFGNYTPDYGDALCDNFIANGPEGTCPSDDTWLFVGNYIDGQAEPGVTDCLGNRLCCTVDPGPPMPGSQQFCCVCGTGWTLGQTFGPYTPIATQTLYGEWYLG